MTNIQLIAIGVRGFTLALGLLLSLPGFAQSSMWVHVHSKTDGLAAKGIPLPAPLDLMPEQYQLYRLDESLIQQSLSTAMLSGSGLVGAKGLSAASISVPFPDGELIELRLSHTTMLEADLAIRRPDIMTFTAVAKNDPRIRGVLDYTTKGFHGLISTPLGMVYIDPRGNAFNRYYLSYYQHNYSPNGKSGVASCGVDPSKHHTLKPETFGSLPFARDLVAAFTTGEHLHEYRIAVAATAEYTAFHDDPDNTASAKDDALSAIVTTINRVNFFLRRDLSIKLNLVSENNNIIFDDQDTVTLTNGNSTALLDQVQPVLDDIIGIENYDIGHIFHTTDLLTSSGIAYVGVVCDPTDPDFPLPNRKGQGVSGSWFPIGDSFDVGLVAHEIGHQFGGTHTFDSEQGSCAGARSNLGAVEPGSGSTIMSYAGICGSDDLQFNADPMYSSKTMEQIDTEYHQGWGGLCDVETSDGNTAPSAVANGTFTIPANTPFELTGAGIDPDVDDVLTYSWEQSDTSGFPTPLGTDSGFGPIFRTFLPVETPTRIFPQLSAILSGNNSTSLGETLPGTNREINFKLTVRDQRGGTDDADIRVNVSRSFLFPNGFRITNLNSATSFPGGSNASLTWDVARTDQSPINCSSVSVSFSSDGGLSFPDVLLENTPNNGSALIQLPLSETSEGRIRLQCVGNIFFDINDSDITLLPLPEITVLGNSAAIENGDLEPSVADFTDFGETDVGISEISSVTRVFEIRNDGEADLEISPVNGVLVNVSGDGATDFEVVDFPAATIAAGASDTFSIRFASSTGGTSQASVSITSNDPDESIFSFSVSGDGVEAEIEIRGNDRLVFSGFSSTNGFNGTYMGQVEVDGGFLQQQFSIANLEDGLLALTGTPKIQLSGSGESDFRVIDNTETSIEQGSTTNSFTIRFDPSEAGQKFVTVTIPNNDQSESDFNFMIEGTTPAVDLEVFGFGPFLGSFQPTDEFDYRVNIENIGLTDASDVILEITLHPDLTFISTEGCAESPSVDTTCTIGDVDAGGETQIIVRASINADIAITGFSKNLRSRFEVNSAELEFRTRNNVSRLSEIVVRYRRPSLSATVSPTMLMVPETTRVTMNFDNLTSKIDAEAVEFQIDLPSGLFTADQNPLENSCDGSFVINAEGDIINFSAGTIPAEGSCALSFDLTARKAGMFTLETSSVSTSIGLLGRLDSELEILSNPDEELEDESICVPIKVSENSVTLICL